MQIPNELKFATHMLTYKENLKELAEAIKALECQLGDNLQQALVKSSSLVKLNKGMRELELLIQAVADMDKDNKQNVKEELLAALRRKLFENQCLLIDDIQNSMLKATEAMVNAGGGLAMLASLIDLGKAIENCEKR